MFTKKDLRNRARRFLDFRSIAVIGASVDPDRIGGKPLLLLRRLEFDGEVFGVNPKYDCVQGYKCVHSIADLPAGVELAIIAVQAPLVIESLEELGKKGVQAAVVFTSGFAEAGPDGIELQRRMRELAYKYGIAVNGPNCVGTISFVNRRPATFASSISVFAPGKIGRVALVSQSGGFAPSIWADAMLAGTGFSHMLTTGNEAVLGFGDYLHLLADDPDTDLVLGYIEGLEDGQEFCAAAEALRRAGKPLVLIKPGRSAEVARVVASHTGQMAGNYEAFRAAFHKHGVIEVETLESLIDHARVLSERGAIDPLAIATTSGGVGVYLTDLCQSIGVDLAKLSESTECKLRKLIPDFGTTKNPVDITAQVVNNSASLKQALIALSDDDDVKTVLFVLNGKAETDKAKEVIDIVSDVQTSVKKPLFTAWLGVSSDIRDMASEGGLNIFTDPARLLPPLGSLRRWKKAAGLRRNAFEALPQATQAGTITAADMSRTDEGQLLLDEWKGMELVERYAVKVPRRWHIDEQDSFERQAKDVAYPCVIKILKPTVAHKSRLGGVITNIQSNEDLRAAWSTLKVRGATAAIVEEQVKSTGPELVIGVAGDATFGQRIVIGSGGVNTNEKRDFVTILPPLSREYLESSLRELRVWQGLSAAEERVAEYIGWIYETIESLCTLQSTEQKYVAEIECNPLLIHASGLIAVDVLAIGPRQ
jgi:acyl-CoA synthetase (NDP forming)